MMLHSCGCDISRTRCTSTMDNAAAASASLKPGFFGADIGNWRTEDSLYYSYAILADQLRIRRLLTSSLNSYYLQVIRK